jgi:hypothetical protein
MTAPTITPLPTPPSRQEPDTFADRSDAFVAALPAFQSEANTLGTFVNDAAVSTAADSVSTAADAVTASAAAAAAIVTADAALWVSEASYAAGANAISLVDFGTYRAITTHTGVATDPSADATNWVLISVGSGSSVAALTPAATVDISLADDDYFTITLDQNTTFTMSNVDAGVDTFNLAITGFDVAGVGYDLGNASYDSVSFTVSPQDTAASDLFFKSDGTKMYVVGFTTDTVYQYSLSTAWDLSTSSYDSVSFSVASQETTPSGLFFKDDGTKMYVVGRTSATVYQYSLSTAWDLSTASYDSVSFSVSSQETNPNALSFKPDGTKMYVVGMTSDAVFQYSLSTAWVVSSASYDSVSFSVSSQSPNTYALFFKDDGTKMYVAGEGPATIFQYGLSTAWDLSTAAYDTVSFSVSSQDAEPNGIFFKPDGFKMYIVGNAGNRAYQYTTVLISTATATYPSSFKFPAGTTPTVPANGILNILEGQTTDGGTTFNVTQIGANFS